MSEHKPEENSSPNSSQNYRSAYERQKKARERAENLLENISRELYDSNNALKETYEKLKNQKSQLLHQEKLASIGQLSAGIAHEINNPAGYVKSNLTSLQQYSSDLLQLMSAYQKMSAVIPSLLIKSTSDEQQNIQQQIDSIAEMESRIDLEYLLEDIPNLIEESIDGTKRITKIVDGLRVFSRIDSDEKEELDVNECIKNTIKLVQNEIKYKAELTQDLQEIPIIMGFPGGLSQVILNMLVNASHAIDTFGEILIQTKIVNDTILLLIKDNGKGIEQETLGKIFDPFYTTKDVGVGTGLGLSISAGIIKQHGGDIDVTSEVGKGTCFTIILPINTTN